VLAIIITILALELKVPEGTNSPTSFTPPRSGWRAWLGESTFHPTPVVIYGLNLLSAATAYSVLQKVIIRQEGLQSPLRQAVGTDIRQGLRRAEPSSGSSALQRSIGMVRSEREIALACFIAAAIVWFIPDRRIDGAIRQYEAPS